MRLVACLALAACATSNPPPASGPGIASADFDDKLVDALCVRDVRCGVYVSLDACIAAQPGPSPHERAQRQADVTAGVVTYDPVIAAQCLDFIANAACTDLAIHDNWTAVQACARFEGGTIANGGACNHDEECASSNCEAAPDGPSAGVCLAGTCQPIELALGGVCGQGYPACPAGSACVEGECRQGSPSGTTCYDQGECALGLACDLERQVCAPPVHEGEICGPLPCAEAGLDCLPTELGPENNVVSRCRRRADRGEACAESVYDTAGLPMCKSGLVCDVNSRVCVDLPVAGQPCQWTECAPGATCVGSTCEPEFADGTACTRSDNCASGDCVLETCQTTAICP